MSLVWYLVERGEALESAAALAGLAGAAGVPGRLLLAPVSNVLPTDEPSLERLADNGRGRCRECGGAIALRFGSVPGSTV